MKLLCIFITLICISGIFGKKQCPQIQPQSKFKCTIAPYDVTKNWLDMVDPCIDKMKAQVKIEIGAAMTYLSMASYFARDTVNRPGFSKFFFESASEEREHAIKIMEYLQMRGNLPSNITDFLTFPVTTQNINNKITGVEALTKALDLEAQVTRNIRDIMTTCENSKQDPTKQPFNDYHLVDYLTTDFLEEQYKGQRDLAGKIATLGKMMNTHKSLAEFLFDKKLLDGNV